MKTKFLVKFLNNSAHMDVDLELADIIYLAIDADQLKQSNSEFIFDHIDETKHLRLKTRANSKVSRKIAIGHLQTTLRDAYIKQLYESASVYFQTVLKSAAEKGLNIDRLLGEHSSIPLTSKEIMTLGSFSKVVERISKTIFRQLENERSTKALIEKMTKKLGLTIDAELIENANPYFEIRHLLVHNDGKADADFIKVYGHIENELGKNIKIDKDIIDKARETISALVREFDKEVVIGGLVHGSNLQP